MYTRTGRDVHHERAPSIRSPARPSSLCSQMAPAKTKASAGGRGRGAPGSRGAGRLMDTNIHERMVAVPIEPYLATVLDYDSTSMAPTPDDVQESTSAREHPRAQVPIRSPRLRMALLTHTYPCPQLATLPTSSKAASSDQARRQTRRQGQEVVSQLRARASYGHRGHTWHRAGHSYAPRSHQCNLLHTRYPPNTY